MPDREKVLKGLECCAVTNGDECRKCPYTDECWIDSLEGMSHLASDALALLKESEPIVRCKDCKHFHPEKLYMCRIHGSAFQPKDRDWFCADGERR